VEVMTLDSFWKQKIVPRIDFIKCDVEGGELEVIRGGLELLSLQRPGWLLEVSRDTSRGVFSLLKDVIDRYSPPFDVDVIQAVASSAFCKS
ncbi:MAG TPA: FkbM family methyltransferase, partial [Nitrososphaera sp.]|nr:FkbM family methyltransferase [Nitrososphaera sp.]